MKVFYVLTCFNFFIKWDEDEAAELARTLANDQLVDPVPGDRFGVKLISFDSETGETYVNGQYKHSRGPRPAANNNSGSQKLKARNS